MFNPFDDNFNRVSYDCKQTESIRDKIIEALSDLSEVKRVFSHRQFELNKNETEIVKLRESNQDLQNSLMRALIQKEELKTKREILRSNINELQVEVESMDQETDEYISKDQYEPFYQRFSIANQHSIATRIQDSKCKLMKFGFSPTHIEMVQQSCSVRGSQRYK